LAGKNWLESREPPERPLITENFPEKKGVYSEISQIPKTPEPIFIEQKPVISNKKPTHANNSLSIKKTIAKSPEKLISKISPISQEKFLLNNPSQKSNQLKISQSLPLTANQEQKSTESKVILLAKIKLLEKENSNLKAENQCLKELVHQEKQRANHAEQQLQKINQQLEQEKSKSQAQIIQSPPLKLIVKPKVCIVWLLLKVI